MPLIVTSAKEALADLLHDGITLAVGGLGLSGNPTDLIEAVRDSGVRDLTVVSNNMKVDGKGLGLLLENSQGAEPSRRTSARTSSSRSSTWTGRWRWSSSRRARSPSGCGSTSMRSCAEAHTRSV